ncbi:MAG: hypothetical protein ACRDQZ_04010 [Mycobacteriales bacterium]
MRIRVVSIAVLAGALGLLAPGSASATVHSGHIVFPEPHNPPSIGVPPPPAVQAKETTREVVIRYNASAGTVTLRAEVFDPTLWGEQIGESFKLGSKCFSYNESVFHAPNFSANMSARPKRMGPLGEQVGGVTGDATLRGYAGHVSSTGTFNGRYFEITFTSSAFRNRSWRCAMLTSFGFSWPRVPLSGWRKAKARGSGLHPDRKSLSA